MQIDDDGSGIYVFGNSGPAIYGRGNGNESGIRGESSSGSGVYGRSDSGYGGFFEGKGYFSSSVGIRTSPPCDASLHAVWGGSTGCPGYAAVRGDSSTNIGILGSSRDSYGVYGTSSGSYAGYFNGTGYFSGYLTKSGGGFTIDHPLNPENKYLNHSFVESPEMQNIYNGIATLDSKGEAWVELPSYFEALNKDFRYQLTPIGAPMPNLYIAQEVKDNRFQIAGGVSGKKVSWQVTGARRDPWALANVKPVEELKPEKERGYYMHPKEYGKPDSLNVERVRNPLKEELTEEVDSKK
ncbi:MAG: hypothetical protein HYX24_05040 [Candidatus Aenigmarchaeota archaeon]|nr:hypothetical protein [Candidatus Aenigmarchaeota archaeon]